jgi:hypothetical protein
MSRARDNANLGTQAGSGLDASDITSGALGASVTGGAGLGVSTAATTALNAKAPLASPDFTGTVDLTGTTVSLDDDEISLDKVNGGTLGTGTIGGSSVVNTSGAITTTGAFTSVGIDDNANALAMTIDVNENVGIGTTDATDLSWGAAGVNKALAIDGTTGYANIHLRGTGGGATDTSFTMGVGDSIFYMAYDEVVGAHRIQVDSVGNVKLNTGNLVIGTAGQGITFGGDPDTRQNSPTVGARTLYDYEEGTWTPTDASGAGLTLSVNGAFYIKVGALVHVNVYFSFPSTANTAPVSITGLPFTSGSGSNYSYLSGRTVLGSVICQIAYSSTNFDARLTSSDAGKSNANMSTTHMLVSGTYRSS